MPLTTRNVSPVDLSVNRLDPSVKKDELLCIANGTLANLIRQLSSLSRNAEQLFSEVHREVLKIDHRANTLVTRIERFAQKVLHPDTRSNPGNLEENMARKAFKSYNPIDQHSLDRQTLPNSLHNLYLKCDSPPHLDQLNPYRDDPKRALRYYTDPSYFFDLWKQEILKECAADGGDKRGRVPPQPQDTTQAGRGGSGRSPLRRRRQPQQQSPRAQGMIYYQSSSVLQQQYHHPPQASAAHQMLQFPVEYQAPQHAMHSMVGSHHYTVQPPPGMSLHVNSNGSGVGAAENYRVVGHPSTVATASYHHQQSAGPSYHLVSQSQHQHDGGLAGLSARVGGIALGNASESALPTNIDALLDEDEDDELPPPPPILSSQQYSGLGASGLSTADVKSSDTSLRNSASNNNHQQGSTPLDGTLTRPAHGGTIQYLPSGQHHANVRPAPIPTPSVPPTSADTAVMVASVTVASFSATKVLGAVNGNDGIAAIDADEEEDVDNNGISGEGLKNEEPKASNLLMEIQSGIKLKKVQRQKEMEEVKSATESNDVAAILRRRMEHVLGCNDDESSESSNSNDGEWD